MYFNILVTCWDIQTSSLARLARPTSRCLEVTDGLCLVLSFNVWCPSLHWLQYVCQELTLTMPCILSSAMLPASHFEMVIFLKSCCHHYNTTDVCRSNWKFRFLRAIPNLLHLGKMWSSKWSVPHFFHLDIWFEFVMGEKLCHLSHIIV